MIKPSQRSMWRGLYLVAGFWLPLVAAAVLGMLGVDVEAAPLWISLLLLATVLGSCLLGGGLWGHFMSRIAQRGTPWKIGSISAITYLLLIVANVMILGQLEFRFVEERASSLPLHRIFMLLFVPATGISCAILSGVLGLAFKNLRLAWRLFWRAGLAGAGAFLVLNVVQEILGRKVGGLNAAATATMLSVTLVGQIGAMLAASAVVGRTLGK